MNVVHRRSAVFACDPRKNLIVIPMARNLMTSPIPEAFQQGFRRLADKTIHD